MMRVPNLLATFASLMILAGGPAVAQSCSNDDFAKAVDGAGASLRDFNQQNAPRLQAKLGELKSKRGWTDTEYEEKSIELLHDARVEEFDRQSNDILTRIDTLGAQTS